MADHPHTIDRWNDTTGETLSKQIAAVGDYLVAYRIVPVGKRVRVVGHGAPDGRAACTSPSRTSHRCALGYGSRLTDK